MPWLESNLKKSGENKFAGFKYYELCDFLPQIIKLCDKYKVCTIVSFNENAATLRAYDCEKIEKDNFVEASTPIEKLEIRGSNSIQAIGGMQTYMRRYLYMLMFDITESDQFDAISGNDEKSKEYRCVGCKSEFKPFTHNGKSYSAGQAYHMSEKKSEDGKPRCINCRRKSEGDI